MSVLAGPYRSANKTLDQNQATDLPIYLHSNLPSGCNGEHSSLPVQCSGFRRKDTALYFNMPLIAQWLGHFLKLHATNTLPSDSPELLLTKIYIPSLLPWTQPFCALSSAPLRPGLYSFPGMAALSSPALVPCPGILKSYLCFLPSNWPPATLFTNQKQLGGRDPVSYVQTCKFPCNLGDLNNISSIRTNPQY